MSLALVLASESKYRRALLDRLALPYTAMSHRLDERSFAPRETLSETALAMSEAKANSIAELVPESFIIASDQIAEIDGEVLHKPGTSENAIAQLGKLEGQQHRLLTAVALRSPDGRTTSALEEHRMHMRPLSTAEIRRYVEADSPLDCCGSYKIECLGITLFSAIEGNDATAIEGLPLIALSRMLRQAGFLLP